MKNKYQKLWEQTARVDEPYYLKAWDFYTKRGLSIPKAAKVKLTDWAIQNGVTERGTDDAVKVRNGRDGHTILVQRAGLSQSTSYWAGFWEAA